MPGHILEARGPDVATGADPKEEQGLESMEQGVEFVGGRIQVPDTGGGCHGPDKTRAPPLLTKP